MLTLCSAVQTTGLIYVFKYFVTNYYFCNHACRFSTPRMGQNKPEKLIWTTACCGCATSQFITRNYVYCQSCTKVTIYVYCSLYGCCSRARLCMYTGSDCNLCVRDLHIKKSIFELWRREQSLIIFRSYGTTRAYYRGRSRLPGPCSKNSRSSTVVHSRDLTVIDNNCVAIYILVVRIQCTVFYCFSLVLNMYNIT